MYLTLRRISKRCASVALFALCVAASPASAGAERIVTADQAAGSVSVIDTTTKGAHHVRVGIFPHNVERCGRRLVLAVGTDEKMDASMADMPMRGSLVGIDAATLAVTSTIALGLHPAHVVCDAAGRVAYVTLAQEDAVVVVDLRTKTILRKIPTGKHPHGMRMSTDGRRLYVANAEGSSVSVIDVRRRTEIARIPVGGSPVQVAVAPDGRFVYATLGPQNAVVAIDLRTARVLRRLTVGRNPIQISITPDGKTLVVANQGTLERPDDRVAIIDAATMTLAAFVHTGLGPHGVAIDPSGRRAAVTNERASTVSVIDIRERRMIAEYPTGDDPNGLTLLP